MAQDGKQEQVIEEGLHGEMMEGRCSYRVIHMGCDVFSEGDVESITHLIHQNLMFSKALRQGVKKHCQVSEFGAYVSGLKH